MPDEHECIHEDKWAVQADRQADMAQDLKLVLKMLRGNGEAGIITKLALQEQCMKKLHERIDDLETSISDERKNRAEDVKGMRNKMWGALITAFFVLFSQLLRFI